MRSPVGRGYRLLEGIAIFSRTRRHLSSKSTVNLWQERYFETALDLNNPPGFDDSQLMIRVCLQYARQYALPVTASRSLPDGIAATGISTLS